MRLSPRDVRALRSGALLMTGIFLSIRLVPLGLSWGRRTVEASRQSVEDAVRARSILESSARSRMRTAALSERAAVAESLVFHASSGTEAAGQLAALVGQRAADAGVELGLVEPDADTVANTSQLTRLSVRVDGVGDVEGLSDLLLLLESDEKAIRIEELSVSQADVSATDQQPERLQLRLRAAALARIEVRPRS